MKIYPITVHGRTRYRLDASSAGKRIRATFPSRRAAEAAAAGRNLEVSEVRLAWDRLPTATQADLMRIHQEADRRGIDLKSVLAQLTTEPASGSTLTEVVERFMEAKVASGKSAAYLRALRQLMVRFLRDHHELTISQITPGTLSTWLSNFSLASQLTYRRRLSALFSFAFRAGHVGSNPIKRLEPITPPRTSTKILTTSQVISGLTALLSEYPIGLPWFVLATLCELRPEEASQTKAEAISLDEQHVVVEAQTSKVGQRRVVYPRKEAMAWLRIAMARGSLPISASTRKRVVKFLRRVMNLDEWPKDITRHTAASFWLSVDGDVTKVSQQLGHSTAVLKRHYMALVTRTEAERFWAEVDAAARAASPSPQAR